MGYYKKYKMMKKYAYRGYYYLRFVGGKKEVLQIPHMVAMKYKLEIEQGLRSGVVTNNYLDVSLFLAD